jgi:uncharacterized protein (TIGR02246 family)
LCRTVEWNIMQPILVFAFCVALLVPATTQDDVGSAHKGHGEGHEAPTEALQADHSRDEAEIRDVQKRQAEAWNRHDPKAYAELFTEDGDVVNVVGWWWKGRPEIVKKLTASYAFVFADSTLTITEVHVRFLNLKIAVAHVRWIMVGARTPKGIPEPTTGIQVQVLQQKAGKWLIASFQNTNALPEKPFPTGPPIDHPMCSGPSRRRNGAREKPTSTEER